MGYGQAAAHQTDRLAEDTQLYQTLRFEADRLVYNAHTATGRLYDAFQIVGVVGGRRLGQEVPGTVLSERRCRSGTGPDGFPCTAD